MKNNDYIKRSDLLDFLQMIPIDLGYREIEDVEQYVKDAPAADVRPERHARWLDMDDCLMCSNCGAPHNEPDKNYCPNCGAKMKGEPKEEKDDE